jgi:hypothetical protein
VAGFITPAKGEGDEPAGLEPRHSTAEYLDALRTCLELGVLPVEGDAAWEAIRRVTLRKERGETTPGL